MGTGAGRVDLVARREGMLGDLKHKKTRPGD